MFKKQRSILLLFQIMVCYILHSQNYFVSNINNNLSFTNPSYVLFNEYALIQLNYRNQWPISNMYTSYGSAYFHHADRLNSNFGAILNYDNTYKGTFTNVGLGLNYAYKLQVGRRSHLLFGLQGFYRLSSNNYSNLTFENPTAFQPVNENQWGPAIHSGLGLLLPEKHFIGISVNNIVNSSTEFGSSRLYGLNYVGRVKIRGYYNEFSFEPLGSISSDLSYVQFQYGANIDYAGLKGGLLINQVNTQFTALIILLGISFENYEFVYTYDLNLSGAPTLNPKMAAHEVTFLRKFQYKGRRNKRGAIKCPDI